jgi:hypothetical protein
MRYGLRESVSEWRRRSTSARAMACETGWAGPVRSDPCWRWVWVSTRAKGSRPAESSTASGTARVTASRTTSGTETVSASGLLRLR